MQRALGKRPRNVRNMAKYLVLYQAEGALSGISVSEMFARSTPEQTKAGLAAWQA